MKPEDRVVVAFFVLIGFVVAAATASDIARAYSANKPSGCDCSPCTCVDCKCGE